MFGVCVEATDDEVVENGERLRLVVEAPTSDEDSSSLVFLLL